MQTPKEDTYFQVLTQIHHAEQTHYWTRFIAFSAIVTGLFVLLSGTEHKVLVSASGAVTSLFWVVIQLKSLSYVTSQKDEFHKWFAQLQEAVQVEKAKPDATFVSSMAKRVDGIRSSTELGVIFAVVVFVLWVALFVLEIGK